MRVPNQRHFDEQGTPSRFLFIHGARDRSLGWLARLLCVAFLACVVTPTAVAQDDDDEDEEDLAATPGLVAAFESNGKRVLRIDPDVAASWTGSPDQRLTNGGFAATWTANLLTQQAGEYRLHAFVEGSVQIELAGQKVLDGQADQGWVNGQKTNLSFGQQPVRIRYSSKPNGQGTLRLFWSADSFPMEPIPPHLFSLEQPNPELVATANAPNLHSAYRCAKCHNKQPFAATDPAPSLTAIKESLSRDWFIAKLSTPPKAGEVSKMPHFGFDKQQSADVAAFVYSQAKKPKTKKPGSSKDEKTDQQKGRRLVRTVGCLACHTLDGIGSANAYSGSNLSDVRNKRSAAWVHTWLSDPKSLNTDHRMPVIKLSKDERRQLAMYLGGENLPKAEKASAEQIERGRLLVTKSRCANCHKIPGMEPEFVGSDSGGSGCLNPDANHKGPRFPQIDTAMAKAIGNWHSAVVETPAPFHEGRQLLERRNCTVCHQRDSATGILPVVGELVKSDTALRKASQGLIPPALTAVGDKLKDAALAEAIAGKQKKVRLPWLSVRMPRFDHSKAESAALLSYLIEHDRVPEHADNKIVATAASAQKLVAGQQLIGSSGFSCIACHAAGNYAPRNVALGTRGSDLLMPGERMRREYFMRWTRSPTRIVPGMEMPSITRPVKGVLGDDIHTQLAAAWDALNDKRFTVPTDPSSFEQFVQVGPGQRPRIIRDVFTDPTIDGGYVAKPLVIGLENGHNLMFDLDRFGFRHWWFGDTARQRTEGKSWYWDVAGIEVGSQTPGTDVVLLSPDGKIITPTLHQATAGRLQSVNSFGRGVSFSYKLNFMVGGEKKTVGVLERIENHFMRTEMAGWKRRVRLTGDVPGHTRLLRVMQDPADTWIQTINPFNPLTIDGERYVELKTGETEVGFLSRLTRVDPKPVTKPTRVSPAERITSVPGFEGVRLPLPGSIMPTSINWKSDGTMVFTSLKGHVFLAKDSDNDGLPDTLVTHEEGLAAPFGVLPDGDSLLVAHKPEILRLTDTDGDGKADKRTVVSTGWGYSDNYHDWTCGLVRDSKGNIYFGLGSDYSQPKRPKDRSLWRGAVLRLTPDMKTEPVSWSFRYPVGFAVDKQDRVFATDNQGVQNTYNEVNHIQMGKHYGVPSRHEPNPDEPETTPAIRVPHPWVRSMNAIVFLPEDHASPFGGHLIGCEYDTHLLVRMTFQTVDGIVQGASYYLSKPGLEGGGNNFIGPICAAVAKNGDVYVGSIHDSGWLGGRNTGAIERIRFAGNSPNGIREIKATPDGFEIELIDKVAPEILQSTKSYAVSTYTREWKGSYGTPDSGRHQVAVSSVQVSNGGKTVRITLSEKLRQEHVYEITVAGKVGELFPATGHYTMKRIPTK